MMKWSTNSREDLSDSPIKTISRRLCLSSTEFRESITQDNISLRDEVCLLSPTEKKLYYIRSKQPSFKQKTSKHPPMMARIDSNSSLKEGSLLNSIVEELQRTNQTDGSSYRLLIPACNKTATEKRDCKLTRYRKKLPPARRKQRMVVRSQKSLDDDSDDSSEDDDVPNAEITSVPFRSRTKRFSDAADSESSVTIFRHSKSTSEQSASLPNNSLTQLVRRFGKLTKHFQTEP